MPSYEDIAAELSNGNVVNPAATLGNLGSPVVQAIAAMMSGPSWLERAQTESNRNATALQQGGVQELMRNPQETMDLAGGFGGTTKPVGIRAYHGSPHDFDRFDISKIGTGEGAQAYGHGLYFAENEGVARQYRKNLAPASADIAPAWNGGGWQVTTRDGGKFGREFFPTKEEAEAFSAKFDKGKMYEVNINADPAHMLDWDGRLGQQPKAVQEYFGKQLDQFGPDARMNAQLAIAGSKTNEGLRRVSRELGEAGVPGIKYLDQGSRTAGQGSSNYVMFDDKLIDILKKYAIPGMFGLGAAEMAKENQ